MLAAGCSGSAVTATGDSAIAARCAANKLIDNSSASPTAAISKVSDHDYFYPRRPKYSGRVRNEDNFSLQLQTLDGAFHLFMKSELRSFER
jgi:hypothetical protein